MGRKTLTQSVSQADGDKDGAGAHDGADDVCNVDKRLGVASDSVWFLSLEVDTVNGFK